MKPKPRIQCNALRPIVFAKDVEAAASFYVDKLGFKRDFSCGESIRMVGVKLGNALIFLEAGTPTPATTTLFFIVGDADALYEFQQAQGVDVGEALTNRPYGYRAFHVKDPWGNNLQFGHPLEESIPANVDLDAQLESCRWAAYHAQTRYGLLAATHERVNLLQERFPGNRVYNSTALQPFNDSFDMLVIDLCSAAKAWLDKGNGLFKVLAQKPHLLRLRTADDFGGGYRGRLVADGVNKAISKLVPDENPVGPDGIRRLRERFRLATECVNNDRNWVRAHRYEKTSAEGPPSDYAIPLTEYVQHVEYLIDHIYKACMAIKAIAFDTRINTPDAEAADLADLIFHGSIESATRAYRLVCRAALRERPQNYDELREVALDALKEDSTLYERAFDGTIDDG